MTDLFICPDCEQATATQPDSLCATCQQWRDQRLDKISDELQARHRPRKRLRDLTGAEFGEACADMVKATERSRQQ